MRRHPASRGEDHEDVADQGLCAAVLLRPPVGVDRGVDAGDCREPGTVDLDDEDGRAAVPFPVLFATARVFPSGVQANVTSPLSAAR